MDMSASSDSGDFLGISGDIIWGYKGAISLGHKKPDFNR
jgi:hypothetical protein